MKAFINACIYDSDSFLKDSYVLFEDEIKEIGPMESFRGADQVYDCSKCIIMPGLINCHTHIYSAFSRGLNIPFNPQSFSDILKQLWWKIDEALDGEAIYQSGLVYGIDCIRNGVTSVIDHHASGLMIKGSLDILKKAVCDELGLRGVFCFETSDRFSIEECIDENIRFGSGRSEKHAGLFGMHASMTLSNDTLRKIAANIGGMPIHIHVAESLEDAEDCRERYGVGIIERLNQYGLLNKLSLLSHCVHISKSEAEIMADRECAAALNPGSNMNNAVGLANYEMLEQSGVKCVLGNDGLGANISKDCQTLMFAMRHNLKSPNKFGLGDLKRVMNNGYGYAGRLLNIKIGRIKEGYKADMLIVPYMPPTPMNEENSFGHIFFGVFDNFHPRDVLIGGEFVMRDYNVSADVEAIYKGSIDEAERVWSRIKK